MPFMFLDLPGEVRNRIYELLLVEPFSINPFYRDPPTGLELFLINRKVSRESRSIFYAQNTFSFVGGDATPMKKWLCRIGRHNSSQLRHLHIDFLRIFDSDQPSNNENTLQYEGLHLKTLTSSWQVQSSGVARDLEHPDPTIVYEKIERVFQRLHSTVHADQIIVEVVPVLVASTYLKALKEFDWIVKEINLTDPDTESEDGEEWYPAC